MSRKILVNVGPYESRAAILDNDQVTELFFERQETEKIVGCVFKGRVANVVPGTQSVFVDIGLQKDAFLTMNSIEMPGGDDDDFKDIYKTSLQDMIKVGQEVLVQVLKEPTPGKGPRSTMFVSLPGRYLVFMPTWEHIGISRQIGQDKERERLRQIGKRLCPKGSGVIFRTAAEGIDERELQSDFRLLEKLWKKAEDKARHSPTRTMVHRDMPLPLKLVREFLTDDVDRFIIDSEEEYKGILEDCDFLSPFQRAAMELYDEKVPLFEKFRVEEEIEKAIQHKVLLDSGGYLYIERTEAMISIDVNSGRFSGGADLEETVFKVNREAAKVIARQIRLRNLAGMLVIDFIDMEDQKHCREVVKTFKEAMKGDRNRPHISDMSELGLVQMTRRRTSASLIEMMKSPCQCCNGRGQVFSRLTLANRLRKLVLDCAQRFEVSTIRVRCHSDLIAFFTRDDQGRRGRELEQRSGRRLEWVHDTESGWEAMTIEPVLGQKAEGNPLVEGAVAQTESAVIPGEEPVLRAENLPKVPEGSEPNESGTGTAPVGPPREDRPPRQGRRWSSNQGRRRRTTPPPR